MSKKTDPSMYESKYARISGDRYFTEPWVTRVLLNTAKPDMNSSVWEPACGRGDISKELVSMGYHVVSTDINMTEFDTSIESSILKLDFLNDIPIFQPSQNVSIITNPPYFKHKGKSMAELFVRRALLYSFSYIAMLMRSEFIHARGRRDLFTRGSNFYAKIILPKRPRWDWWYRDKPEASPRHNYSWFVWLKGYKHDPMILMGDDK